MRYIHNIKKQAGVVGGSALVGAAFTSAGLPWLWRIIMTAGLSALAAVIEKVLENFIKEEM